MLGKVWVPLAMLAVFLGTASAGEENLMAMRGSSPDGRPGLNRFRPEPGGGSERRAGAAGAYVGWRDTCVQVPRQVAGQAISVERPAGFGWAAPLSRQPVPGEPSAFDLFIRELTRG